MEKIKSLVAPEVFRALYVSHVEIVADEVPNEHQPWIQSVKSFSRAVDICMLRNDRYLGKIKARVLNDLLSTRDRQ